MKKIRSLTLLATTIPFLGLMPQITSCNLFNTNKCTIIYQSSEGGKLTGVVKSSIIKGTKWKDVSNKPKTQEYDGYIFDNWYNGDNLMNDDYVINSDITVTAKFIKDSVEKVKLSLLFTEGGTISGNSIKVPKGAKWKEVTNKPTVIPDKNYLFDGWYDGLKEDSKRIENSDVISNDMTLIAKFSKIELTKTSQDFFVCNNNNFTKVDFDEKDKEKMAIKNAFNVFQFNYKSIGYLSIQKSMGYYSGNFTVSTSNNKTTITTKHEPNPTTCVIDHVLQTITFEDYEKFNDFTKYGPMTHACYWGMNYFYSVEQKEYVSKSLTIDLNDYHLTTYCYNDEGYIPFEFYKNLFNITFGFEYNGVKYTNWDYAGDGLYEIKTGADNSAVPFKKKIKEKATSVENNYYDTNHMEYLYNLLAFTLDLRWGLPQRNSRSASGKTIKYLEGGAYAALQKYHDDFVSTDDNKSCDTMRQIFKEVLDDGGHSTDWILNSYATKAVEQTGNNYYGVETNHTSSIHKNLNDARNTSKNDIISHWESKSKTKEQASLMKGYYEEYTDADKQTIAYITFDSFAPETTWGSKDEVEEERELPSNTNDSNYGDDTLRLAMYANQKIKDNNIKNVVVDLSLNGGGAVYVEHFIASWLCGGVTQKIWNPKNNQYCEYLVKADINGDKKFDENDYLDPSIKLFIITSSNSFSCANLLSCNVQDNRTQNTYFIGTRSGGGACFIDSDINLGRNSCCNISSTSHMLRKSSTNSNFVTVDDGCDITTGWEIDENNTHSGFYDRDNINKKIWGNLQK